MTRSERDDVSALNCSKRTHADDQSAVRPAQRLSSSKKVCRSIKGTRVVPSGANQSIGFYTSLNPDCTSRGTVDIRITKQPKHGALNIAAATGFPNYPKENIRYKCNQHRVKGMQINYKSVVKYSGDDALELLVLFPNGFAWEVQYDVSVR